MDTFNPSPAPSQSSSAGVETRVNQVDFGDGYSARSPDGINSVIEKYNLFWKAITEAERETICSFFAVRKGSTAFAWVPPNQVTAKAFTCKDWSWTYGEYNLVDLRASFKQTFET